MRSIRAFAFDRRLRRSARRWTAEDQRRLEFYGKIVSSGCLVFDIGANYGNRVKVFSKLGARVVAVEPQPACARFLRRAFPGITVVEAAAGASEGQAEMLVADVSTISSLSPEWVAAVRRTNRFGQARWTRRIRVPVITLDALISRFGRPDFVKVDVEGYEEEVIIGLSCAVSLSFELTPERAEAARACCARLAGLAPAQFNLSFGESMTFSGEWIALDDVLARISAAPNFGDVYVRYRNPEASG